jgi:beta-aspartyl-peptidase (threonine type)
MGIALVVHGGAGTIRPEVEDASKAGMERALARGWAILQSGGSGLDACEQAIVELEDDPAFNAGVGSHLNREGKAQLDAILMDGAALRAGAVAAVERIRNPIRLARLVLERGEPVLLAGAGAEAFAQECGIPLCDPADLVTPGEYERWRNRANSFHLGTVGAVALDSAGNLYAGTSTGGIFLKHPGRVGDSPLIGCGCFADNESAAVSCTGKGELIMKVVMAKSAADFVAAGQHPQAAAEAALNLLERKTGGKAGLILVDRAGRIGVSFSTPHMSWQGTSS